MPVPDRSVDRDPRIAIVAADAWTALGRDLDEAWPAILRGDSAVSPVAGFDASGFGDPYAAQVWSRPPEPETDSSRRLLGRHGPLIDDVLKRLHAGLEDEPRDRVGLYVCLGAADTPVVELAPAVQAARDEDGRFDARRFFAGAFRRLHPLWPLSTLQNVAVGQTSIDLDVRGENVVLASEGDGFVRTIREAGFALADGDVDLVLAGGASHAVSAAHLARLRLRGSLGRGPAFPCARDGDGESPGEAAAGFLLATEASAGGRRPLAFLRGGATTFGRAPDRPGPTEDAFRRAIAGALDAAGGPRVDAVFLHAEGLAGQDAAELRAVTDLVGTGPRLVATKGALGHADGASPAVDVALAVRSLGAGLLPPSVTRGPWLEELDGRLTEAPVEGDFRHVLVVAAGSHGGAGALVLEAAS